MDSIFINIIEDGVFAAIAAIGFSSISNTPRRAYLMCGLIAAIGHSIRYVLMLPALGGMHIIAASTIASFVIGILAVLFAGRIKCPAEVCFFPALLPMIPGMYAYRTEVLNEITQLPQSSLESAESLEQLRWLENGYRIKVGLTDKETIGIDTPADLQRAIESLNRL